jgi:hypothetical protein
MTDCNCAYPALECACCCKEKAVLQGLMNRLNGYECYLRTFVVPASCQNLPWSAKLAADGVIIGGANTKYGLNKYVNGGSISTIKVWPTIGCKCDFSQVSQALYHLNDDCWGSIPDTTSTGLVKMNVYLSGKYQFKTGTAGSVAGIIGQVLANGSGAEQTLNGEQARFGVLKGAIEYIQEAKRHYHTLLTSLPC